MITLTQGDYVFKNNKETTTLIGLFQIHTVEELSPAPSPAEFGFIVDPTTGYFSTSAQSYAFVNEHGMWSSGDPKPYGVVVVTRDFAAMIYDAGLANHHTGGLSQQGGFALLLANDLKEAPLAFDPSKILPTQHCSNEFAKLYTIRPSGVIALQDKVIASYDTTIDDDAVRADYVAYLGITPYAAFNVHEMVCPTLFLPKVDGPSEFNQRWAITAAHALSSDTFVGKVPATSGFLVSDYNRNLSSRVLQRLRAFKELEPGNQFMVRQKPLSSAHSQKGTILSVVTPKVLADEDLLSQVASGILSEPSFVDALASNAWDALLTWGEKSAYDYYTLHDDFSALLLRFKELYEKFQKEIIEISFSGLVSMVNNAQEHFNKWAAGTYLGHFTKGCKDTVLDFDEEIMFNQASLDRPEPFTFNVNLRNFMRSFTTACSFFQIQGGTLEQKMEELTNKLPCLMSDEFAKQVYEEYSQGRYPSFMAELQEVVKVPLGEMALRGVKFHDPTQFGNKLLTAFGVGAEQAGVDKVRAICSRISSTSVASANLDKVVNAESDLFNGLRCKWFCNFYWLKHATYEHVYSYNNMVTHMQMLINPTLGLKKYVFYVDSACVGKYYNRVSMSHVLRQNGLIIQGCLDPTQWKVVNLGIDYTRKVDYPGSTGADSSRAKVTKHRIESNWEPIIPQMVADPVAPPNVGNFGADYVEACGNAAAEMAFLAVKPMIDAIEEVATASPIGSTGGALVRVADVTKVSTFDDQYLAYLQQMIELVSNKLPADGVGKLNNFAIRLQGLVAQSKTTEPIYYLTQHACGLSNAQPDDNAQALAIMYGGNIID